MGEKEREFRLSPAWPGQGGLARVTAASLVTLRQPLQGHLAPQPLGCLIHRNQARRELSPSAHSGACTATHRARCTPGAGGVLSLTKSIPQGKAAHVLRAG